LGVAGRRDAAQAVLQGSDRHVARHARRHPVRQLLFVSGVGGWHPSRRPRAGDIKQQTADALDLMKALLEEAGASMADLLQVQVALVDSDRNWEPMNEVYNTKVPEPRPVRSYFGCTGFGTPGQLVQIDAIAYVD